MMRMWFSLSCQIMSDLLACLNHDQISWHVLIMIGTCMLGRIINVIKESEMDRLSTPWAVVRASRLLSQQGTVVEDLGVAGDGPTEQGAMVLKVPAS